MSNLIVEAGPGSGKTTTLTKTHNYLLTGQIIGNVSPEQYVIMESARQMFPKITPNDACFVCMTTSGRDDIASKLLTETKVFTYNALGLSLLSRWKKFQHYDPKRGEKIIESLTGRRLDDLPWKQRLIYYNCLKFIRCLKEELLYPTPENVFYVQDKYGIDAPPPENIEEMDRIMKRMMHLDGTVEYIDQVWSVVANYKTTPPYKIIYVDECQDLSMLKLLLIVKSAQNIFFCGDPFQSINGFAGACYNVFERLLKMSQKHLPLKTCFRCPPNRIERANSIRPARIVPHKTEVVPDKVIPIDDLGDYLKSITIVPEEHMMIARLNNILLRVGIKLLLQGIQCHVMTRHSEGNSINEIVLAYIKSSRASTLKELVLFAKNDISAAENKNFNVNTYVVERANCILELAEGLTTIRQVVERIQRLTDEQPHSIPLCTIHKSKGLESKNIYILYPPVQLNCDNHNQAEQEINLEFVSETRSSHQTIYVVE